MSKIMDRISDLEAVDWQNIPDEKLDEWERLALEHNKDCRCEKCALFFARLTPEEFSDAYGCAISALVIQTLREHLVALNKL